MVDSCPCCDARIRAEKANAQAQRALYDLHHTTIKGLQEENTALHKRIFELETTIKVNAGGPTEGPWWVERPEGKDAYIAYGVRGDLSQTYDVTDAYNVDTDYELMARAPVLRDTLAATREENAQLRADAATALAEYEQLLASHAAQTKMIDQMQSDLRDAFTENAALRDTATQYKALYEGERTARLEREEQIETLRATWNDLHGAYSWTVDRLINTQRERDEARASSSRLLRALKTVIGRWWGLRELATHQRLILEAQRERLGEAGMLYKVLQTIRRDAHFAERTVDTAPDKWEALCLSIMRQIDEALPHAPAGEKEAQRLWEEMRAALEEGVIP